MIPSFFNLDYINKPTNLPKLIKRILTMFHNNRLEGLGLLALWSPKSCMELNIDLKGLCEDFALRYNYNV
jgi:hypothetical protein